MRQSDEAASDPRNAPKRNSNARDLAASFQKGCQK
jgi:hypothetical protein